MGLEIKLPYSESHAIHASVRNDASIVVIARMNDEAISFR